MPSSLYPLVRPVRARELSESEIGAGARGVPEVVITRLDPSLPRSLSSLPAAATGPGSSTCVRRRAQVEIIKTLIVKTLRQNKQVCKRAPRVRGIWRLGVSVCIARSSAMHTLGLPVYVGTYLLATESFS